MTPRTALAAASQLASLGGYAHTASRDARIIAKIAAVLPQQHYNGSTKRARLEAGERIRSERQTPPDLGSGPVDATEERLQGDGVAPVRGRRAEARAGLGAVSRDDAPRRGSAADAAGGGAALARRER